MRWGSETGVVVHDRGGDVVWLERDDEANCFVLRDLIAPVLPAIGERVKWPPLAGVGEMRGAFETSDGTQMVVLEYGHGRTHDAPLSELVSP